MKPAEAKAIIDDVKKRGYIEHNDHFYPPNSPQAELIKSQTCGNTKKKLNRAKAFKTGWIDDSRNLKNKANQTDMFIALVKAQLSLDVWPEFYFSAEREYRFDYAIPELKLAIEVEGGIWAKGNSGHSSGKGISRDMQKSSLAASKGWFLIRVVPKDLLSLSTVNLIKKVSLNGK